MTLIKKGYNRALEDTPRQLDVVYVFCGFCREEYYGYQETRIIPAESSGHL